jgi:hypothetical protein
VLRLEEDRKVFLQPLAQPAQSSKCKAVQPFLSKIAQQPHLRKLILFASASLERTDDMLRVI